MVIFVKPSTAITTKIVHRPGEDIHHEAEICYQVKEQHLYAAARRAGPGTDRVDQGPGEVVRQLRRKDEAGGEHRHLNR